MKERRYWVIQGWDGSEMIFERKVLCGQITENSMKLLLRALVSKMSLNFNEIINSHAKRNTKIFTNHLQVNYSNGKHYMLTCGDNPYAIATVESLPDITGK